MAAAKKPDDGHKVVADNRKARHDFEITETWEAGIALLGTEVKSLRDGQCTLREAYVMFRDGDAWVIGMHIPEYSHGNVNNHEPVRDRQLLLHRREIEAIRALVERKGLTVIPLKLYFTGGRAKLLIGAARGKKLHDKRDTIKARDQKRQIERALRGRDD